MDFILATGNPGKAREVLAFFGSGHTVRTLADIGYFEEIVEDGQTFEDNATIKAKEVHNWYKGSYDYILADDSGLIVDAMDGGPGVQTATWMGTDIGYEEKTSKMLELLADVPMDKRTARFVSVIVAINPAGKLQTVKGILEGAISSSKAGLEGFGYDPIFYVPELGKNLAELELAEKNKISHRAKAMKLICDKLGVKFNG